MEYVRLIKNFGHPAEPGMVFSGCARATLNGLLFSYINDFDYAVCVEQGCLV